MNENEHTWNIQNDTDQMKALFKNYMKVVWTDNDDKKFHSVSKNWWQKAIVILSCYIKTHAKVQEYFNHSIMQPSLWKQLRHNC